MDPGTGRSGGQGQAPPAAVQSGGARHRQSRGPAVAAVTATATGAAAAGHVQTTRPLSRRGPWRRCEWVGGGGGLGGLGER